MSPSHTRRGKTVGMRLFFITLISVLLTAGCTPDPEDPPGSPPSLPPMCEDWAFGALPCNGGPELCDRGYDQVAYGTTHNAMSNTEVLLALVLNHLCYFHPKTVSLEEESAA